MNLSISTWNYHRSWKNNNRSWKQGKVTNLHAAISEILSGGFGIELWLGWAPDPAAVKRDKWDELKELLADAPDISLHCSKGSTWDWNWNVLKEEIDMCEYLGGDIVVVHRGTIDVENAKVSEDYNNARMAAEYAASKGVILALENGLMGILRRTLEEVGDMSENSGLGICIDVGHANMGDQGFDDAIAAFIDEFRDDLVHFHLADNHGEIDEHLVPGMGTINWETVCSKIAGMDFQRRCALELNTQDAAKAATDAVEYLAKFQRYLHSQ